MSEMIRNASNGFWDQYPVGTKLNWPFLSHRLNQNRIAIFNSFMLFLSLYINISRIWTVLAAPFLSTVNRDVIFQHVPTGGSASRYTYLAIVYPIVNLLAILALLVAIALLAGASVILPIIAAVVMGIWALVVLLLFFLWLTLYRYPAFEIVYPRLRKRILTNNSHVYHQLPGDPPSIRVVRLKAGNADDKIECDLIHGPLVTMDFEALSYVWGVTLMPYTIQVNKKPFYITYNLHSALKELRHSDRERLIWIDAMCINQHDNTEKGTQVQMMRDIYAKASRVVVWLGKATQATSPVFDLVRQFSAADADAMDVLWKDRVTLPQWRKIRRELESILQYEWWGRAWIIQEIAVARIVIMQRGPHQVDWEALHKFLNYPPFLDGEFDGFDAPKFAADVQELRLEENAHEPISNTLLGLALRFRFQSATFGSDKLYALLGLLKPGGPSLLIPDYSKLPEDVFLEFTVSCLENNKNLTVIALAAGTELQGVSWCRDWRFSHDGWFDTIGLATHPPHGRAFSASGSQPPVFKVDLSRRMLSLQGYEVDTIERIGDFHQQVGSRDINWDLALRAWERVASGLLNEDPESREAFNRTITVDCWMVEPLDWRKRIVARPKRPQNDEDRDYKKAVDDACINRRFFVTKNGRFGLGPWNLKKNDTLCTLLGGKTPFILRQFYDKALMKGRVAGEEDKARVYHKVIGEVFVHGLMYYQGSMEDDIESTKVVTSWFHLL